MVESNGINASALKVLRSEISSGGSVEKVGRIVFASYCVSMLVQAFFDSGEKTSILIETGEILFDGPERKKDNGAHCRAIEPNQHVARAAA